MRSYSPTTRSAALLEPPGSSRSNTAPPPQPLPWPPSATAAPRTRSRAPRLDATTVYTAADRDKVLAVVGTEHGSAARCAAAVGHLVPHTPISGLPYPFALPVLCL
ncbi:hypothetical protein PVAP13_5NG408100 [Panicum virgatum]|uniref:Uncharacterized protein n=1 Tax=Panicum virgatum TaxID=38727 RepID=A0A8T0RYH1_PANVG|nr:hypothetical protein PVAP13_5NG408100 [Panicum virgatum]